MRLTNIQLPRLQNPFSKARIIFHSLTVEDIWSASPVRDNSVLIDFSLKAQKKRNQLDFLVAKFFVSGGDISECKRATHCSALSGCCISLSLKRLL